MLHAPVKVAVVGLGHWGPNIARNLGVLDGCELAWCCDLDPATVDRFRSSFPGARFTMNLDEVLQDESVSAVVIATPVPTHAQLASRVLETGRDCFVEKPIAQSVDGATRLVAEAESRNAILMVGHLLEYHPAVSILKELLDSGELGDPRYLYSQRVNLGKLRSDENALWSLGAHDVAVMLALVDDTPQEVSARGECYVRDGVQDVVFAYLRFESGIACHLHLSWLDPHKERKLTIVGSKRMATFDDMSIEQKVTIYDRGFDPNRDSYGDFVARKGETRSPAIRNSEPLQLEFEHFIACVRDRRSPRSNGRSGLRVVRVLEALQTSLSRDGEPQRLDPLTAGV